MTTAAAPDREFSVFAGGDLRELMLDDFRWSLRLTGQVNPATGRPYTPIEIATATAMGSPRWIDANGLDLVLMSGQQRGLWLADQIRYNRASTVWLKSYHGPLWGEDYLPASGGSGTVSAPGIPGTTFHGSTTIGDPAATVGTAPDQTRYQVLFTETVAIGQDSVTLTLVAIDTGEVTNLDVDTPITWTNPPSGMGGPAPVLTKFTGGTEAETDADFGLRLGRKIRYKQGAGNRAQIRSWAEKAFNNAIETAFVFSCAQHAGSTIVAVTQKRAKNVKGPLGRIPSAGTLAQVIALLTPPNSPLVPAPPYVLVTGVTGVASNLVLSLSMPSGSSSGWADIQPWPGQSAGTPPSVTALTNQTHFQVTSLAPLPSGVTAPAMMIWNATTSRFIKLDVASVTLNAGNVYDVVLAQAPSGYTIAVGNWMSPYSKRLDTLGSTIEGWFDTLGPGEIVDVSSSSTDLRAHRAYRFPKPNEEYPQRAGAGVLTALEDALGASLSDGVVESVSVTVPPLPADVTDGPNMIVAGKVSLSVL